MAIRSLALLALKVVVLTILFIVALTVGNLLFVAPAITTAAVAPDRANAQLMGMLLMAVVDTLVVTLIIVRSRWRGWRLALAAAFSLYGVMTFMAQIETAWFAPAMTTMRISPALIRGLFLQTLPLVLIWAPLAVILLTWGQEPAAPSDVAPPLPGSWWGWAWRLALIAVAYLALYNAFGYLVAWQNPEVRALYDDGANPLVFAPERLIPFQLLRGLLWALFALPVIRMTRGSRWQIAVVVGLLLALPMNMFHAMPNDLMTSSVRLSHFIETATSNFIFGLLLTRVLLWAPAQRKQPLAPLARPR